MAPKAHWCMCEVRASLPGLIPQKAKCYQLARKVNAVSENAVCCIWCYVADRSQCPCWPMSTYNEHESIKNGPWSNGKRCHGLMNHILFTSCRWLGTCVYFSGKEMTPRCTMGRSKSFPWMAVASFRKILFSPFTFPKSQSMGFAG